MLNFFLRRLGGAIPTLFIIIAISFFMIRLAPGGPFARERQVPPEVLAALNRQYHLDEPLWQQFLRYIGDLLQGDFGPSFKYKDFRVTDLILQGFPTSLQLGLLAISLALIIGLSLGIWAALRQNTIVDYTTMGVSMLGIAVPNFVVAPVLTLIFGLMLGWLPVGGWGHPANYVLPVIALCLSQIASIARLMRASMIEVLRSNYVRTAHAKGLPERIVLRRHAIRAALLPVVSFLGPAIANIITGSVVIEQIFSIPGIGRYFVQASLNRDYTMVMGVTVFYGALIIFCNLLADLAYGLLDPKVRYD
ncbi:oligopeptide ABC transporter permease OppB [Dongia sedimenti]|uniref:Oligopeptide ABC transporter permease OppB n=1 Tax=Dongia sedimenti TaxID=3064282 RepID=A0ABU0YHB7_9PROT|nr:oligopeptide ABC transporter permease OppB [Rhodospirillaceae bacterium R-7]